MGKKYLMLSSKSGFGAIWQVNPNGIARPIARSSRTYRQPRAVCARCAHTEAATWMHQNAFVGSIAQYSPAQLDGIDFSPFGSGKQPCDHFVDRQIHFSLSDLANNAVENAVKPFELFCCKLVFRHPCFPDAMRTHNRH
jgi:hypothetical protein